MQALRAFIAVALLCGVAITVGLSAAPQLHDWLHKTDSPAGHQCAATLLRSGSWEDSACEPVQTARPRGLHTPSLLMPGVRVLARVESSVLEHAPPIHS